MRPPPASQTLLDLMAIATTAHRHKVGNIIWACWQPCGANEPNWKAIDKIRSGEMGDIPLIRANRLGGVGWMGPQGDKSNDLMSQLQFGRIHLYWIGSGHYVDYLIHQIDECCWIKDGWPVSATGKGDSANRPDNCSQNLANYSLEYTFADGGKAVVESVSPFATFIHGSRRAAQF